MAADRPEKHISATSPVPMNNSRDFSHTVTEPRWVPPFKVWGLLILAAAVVVCVRATDITADHTIDNVVTWTVGFAALMTLIIWFGLYSGHSLFVRLIPLVGLLGSITVFFIVYRIDHVSGELVPVFSRRFSAHPDQLLPQLPNATGHKNAAGVNLRDETKYDFPQFLGPHRSAALPNLKLAHKWSATKPRLIWKQLIGAGWSGFSAVNGYAITMEQRGPLELTTCYDLKTGENQWSHATEARYQHKFGGIGPRSTPTIYQGKVYSLGVTGQLHCLDGASGELLWKRDLCQEFGILPEEDAAAVYYGRSNSPLIMDDMVVVPAGGATAENCHSLVAYDKDTGEEIWRGGNRQISYSSPTAANICGVRQILTINEKSVAGHDPTNGHVLWEHEWSGDNLSHANISQAVAVNGNKIFLSKAYGTGAMLLQISHSENSGWSAEKIWSKHNILRTKFANVAVKDKNVYGLSDGILQCAEINTGRSRWKRGRYGHGQILLVGDLILVLSESGKVHLVEANPQKYQELADFQAIEGTTWNNICLYGPYLLVRNAQEAACYELPLQDLPDGR